MTQNSEDSYIARSYDLRQKSNQYLNERSDRWGMFAQTALNGIMGGATSWVCFKAIMGQHDEKFFDKAVEQAKQMKDGSAWLDVNENFINSCQRRVLPSCPLHYGIIAGGVLAGVALGYLTYSAIKAHEKEKDATPSQHIDAATAQRDVVMLKNNPAIEASL